MTPLIDVVFMLILFFMLTLQLEKEQAGQVDLPNADEAEVVKKMPPESLLVVVLPDGNLVASGNRMTLGDFEEQMLRTQPERLPKELVIRGDGSVAFDVIQGVLQAASTVGVTKVNLLADRESEGELE